MGRFSSRLARIEEAVIPRRTASVVLESLTADDLNALVIQGHRHELKLARARGDKSYAADLALVILHETGRLNKLPHGKKLERTSG